jgi:hypothetical protein
MKYFFLFFFSCLTLLTTNTVNSQIRVGNNRNISQPPQSKTTERAPLNITKMTHLFLYEPPTTLRVLRIKDKAKQTIITYELETYNNKLIEIKAFNKALFDTSELFLKSKINESKRTGDPYIMTGAKVKLTKMLAPIRKKVEVQKNLLNLSLKKELTTKQYSKWLKYQKSKSGNRTKTHKRDKTYMQGRFNRQGQVRRNF